MKFSDYFSNSFETRDKHYIDSLQTRYYKALKAQVKLAIAEVATLEGTRIADQNDTYDEILIETANYSAIFTLSNPKSLSETGVDIMVTTTGLLPMGKGKKVIERIYGILDSKLTFAGVGRS